MADQRCRNLRNIKKDLDGDFIPKDVQTEYQVEEMQKTGTSSGSISTIMEEQHRVKQETANSIDNLELHQAEEPDKPDSNLNNSLILHTGKSHQDERNSGTNSNLWEEICYDKNKNGLAMKLLQVYVQKKGLISPMEPGPRYHIKKGHRKQL